MIYEVFIVNSLKNVTYFSFCEKQKIIRGTFHLDIIRLHAGSQEQGGVAAPRNHPATGSDANILTT